jgi:uncharacterized membrane protein YidH (DUF202 family)
VARPPRGMAMTTNLRISLTVLSIGFAIEGLGELYTHFYSGDTPPGESILFVLPAILTLLGLAFVWVGRREWNEVHLARVRTANRVFAASLLGGFVAAALVGGLLTFPQLGTPAWAQAIFGAAVGSLVFGTFVTYAYLVFHLVGGAARGAVVVALVWAFGVSAAVAVTIAGSLATVLQLVTTQSLVVPAFVAPVDALIAYLFVSYFLLLAAYIEAHVAVARGQVDVPGHPGRPVTRRFNP